MLQSQIKQGRGDKKYWHNLEVTHNPRSNDRYIEIKDVNPGKKGMSYVRKYYRKDKHKIKGFKYKKYTISKDDEKRFENT